MITNTPVIMHYTVDRVDTGSVGPSIGYRYRLSAMSLT